MIELHGGETTQQNTGGENTGAGNNVAENTTQILCKCEDPLPS